MVNPEQITWQAARDKVRERCDDCPRLIGMDLHCCNDCPPLEARMTSPQPDSQPTELPPMDVTDEDLQRTDHRYRRSSAINTVTGLMNDLHCRERQLLYVLQQHERLTGTLQAERTLREQTEAEMRAELETERGARLDAEEQYRQGLISSAHWQHLSETAKAENTRLREAARAATDEAWCVRNEFTDAEQALFELLSPAEGKGGQA